MPRDIEEFLKMAAQRRQQQKQGGAAGTPAKPPQSRPASPPPARRPPVQPPNDDIVVIGSSGEHTDMRRQSVSDHVRSHIDTSSLGEHASQLGEEVGLADDKLDARLHETFDHQVGDLDLDAYAQEPVVPVKMSTANDLLEMLNNPKSIRQAILISEVLKRPNFD